jgi:opacity protein-like surface antigen
MNVRWMMWATCLAAGLAPAAYADILQITPFYGYRFGGQFEDADTGENLKFRESACWGGVLDVRLSEATQVEFYYSRQETELKRDEGLFAGTMLFDLDVDYYHLGGTYTIPYGPWEPFVLGTLGATHLAPDAPGTDSLTRFSLGLGGGLRFFPTKHLGLYLAGRGLFTALEGTATFRSESGEATVRINSDGFWQAEFQAGLVFAF